MNEQIHKLVVVALAGAGHLSGRGRVARLSPGCLSILVEVVLAHCARTRPAAAAPAVVVAAGVTASAAVAAADAFAAAPSSRAALLSRSWLALNDLRSGAALHRRSWRALF